MCRIVYFITVALLGSVAFLSAPLPATSAILHRQADTLQADALGPFKGDFAEIRMMGKTKYLHRSGKVVVDKPVQYGKPVCIAVKDGSYGAINSNGDVIADFIYDEIRYEYADKGHPGTDEGYHYFLAIVQLEDKVGAIDTLGKTIAPPVYANLRPINAHVLAAQQEGKWGLLSLIDGSEVQSFTYDDISKNYMMADYLAVTVGGKKGIRSPDGKRKVVPVVYDDLMSIRLDSGRLLLGRQGNEVFLTDTLGKRLTMEQYDRMTADGPMVRVERGGKIGWLASDGRLRIPVGYDDAGSWVDGKSVVSQNGKKGVLAADGQLVVPCQYDDIEIIDESGRLVVPGLMTIARPPMIPAGGGDVSRWQDERNASKGDLYFMAQVAGKYSLLDQTGKTLLPMEYNGIQFRKTGALSYLFVIEGDRYGLNDVQGNELLPVSYRLPTGDYGVNIQGVGPSHLIGIPDGDSVGLYDLKQERLLLQPEYEQLEWQLGSFIKATNRLGDGSGVAAPVSAYFRADGRPLIRPTENLFVHAVDTDRYVVKALKDGYWSATLFNTSGKKLYQHPQWDFSPHRFSKRLVPDSIGASHNLPLFQGGLLKVDAEKNLFVDREGNEFRFSEFDFVDDFFAGLAMTSKTLEGKTHIGIIDSAANVVLPLEYARMDKLLYTEMRKISRNNKIGVIDLRGRLLFDTEYEAVGYLERAGLLQVRLDGKVGLASVDGTMVLPAEYEAIRVLSDRLLRVEKDKKFGFVSSTGDVLIAPRYETAQLNEAYHGYFPALVKVGERWTYVQADGTELPVSAGDKLGY